MQPPGFLQGPTSTHIQQQNHELLDLSQAALETLSFFGANLHESGIDNSIETERAIQSDNEGDTLSYQIFRLLEIRAQNNPSPIALVAAEMKELHAARALPYWRS